MTLRLTAAAAAQLRRVLPRARQLLLLSGALLLGYCAFVLADAWIFQARQSQELAEQAIANSAPPIVQPEIPPRTEPTVWEGEGVGRLEIPRLGVSTIVVEGVGARDLRRAVGHIPGTAFPGESGNVGIAGHRDTYFRPLQGVEVDDLITLTTPSGQFQYRVVSSSVVSPDAVDVLDPTGQDVLTLVTCHPFYYVGPAPNRFIVRAHRI